MISVVIPVYNTEAYIDECIGSIVEQSVADWECILIDDGSADDSGLKCDVWARRDRRIRVIHQSNSGVSVARNVGIEHARGEYLYFLDSDDWCETTLFEHISRGDMVFGAYFFGTAPIVSKIKDYENYPLAYLRDDIRACMGSFVVKRSLVIENNILFEPKRKYAEDLSFILRCLLCAKSVKIVGDFFMHYRQVEESAVHTFNMGRFDAYFSRLWLLNDVLLLGNVGVISFLHHYACVESIILVTRELFARGVAVRTIKDYYKVHPVMYITLMRAMRNPVLRKDYVRISKLLVFCPRLFKIEVRCIYKWYDIHAFFGNIKQMILCK